MIDTVKHSTSSIRLTNVRTKSEADNAYKKFVSDVRKHNIKNTIAIVCVIAAYIGLIALFKAVLDEGACTGFCIGTSVIAFMIIGALIEDYDSACIMLAPPIYLYHQIVESNNILNVSSRMQEDGSHVLRFDVSDADGEVHRKYLYNFKRVEKVGITEVEADLLNQRIYIPYINNEGEVEC